MDIMMEMGMLAPLVSYITNQPHETESSL